MCVLNLQNKYIKKIQENLNTKSYISTIKAQILDNLRYIQHAPSVQMQEVNSDHHHQKRIQNIMKN